MAHTVVSIFENLEQAQKVQEVLLGNGFTQDQVSIRIASYKKTDTPENQHPEETSEGFLSSITDFFKDLFGSDDHQVEQYARAAHHGALVSVHTATESDADKAAAILDAYGEGNTDEVNADISSPQHTFLDDPLNPVFSKTDDHSGDDIQSRASRLKSRIVERSVNKGNF
ncbi:hypothetical protein [Dyadobacter sp. CY356]|uniref:hypothetical protein n=1 Tax=Dyadobacter sp. CY356 TaxID=2906442 RepID=UPI001F3FC9F8|nr:hypothetical protein [Dyadobacter sp. CY356]MCF0054577.1 hypothetical protein [Dyadobacter sp. CY356]